MAIELITGRAGTPHVDSADVGAFNAAMFGGGVYTVEGASATLPDANHVLVSAGELMCEGRHIRITGSGETLAIDNGLSGYRRIDIVAMHYTRDSSDIESCSLVVIKGTQSTSTPQEPVMPATGKLLDGAANVYWPLYRIVIDGLTPQAPVKLAEAAPVLTKAENALDVLGVKDHITAYGASNGWNWVKYSSGRSLFWSFVYNSQGTATGNARYCTLYFPYTLTTVSTALATTYSVTRTTTLGYLGAAVRGVTNTGCEVVFDWSAADSGMLACVLVIGNWK